MQSSVVYLINQTISLHDTHAYLRAGQKSVFSFPPSHKTQGLSPVNAHISHVQECYTYYAKTAVRRPIIVLILFLTEKYGLCFPDTMLSEI